MSRPSGLYALSVRRVLESCSRLNGSFVWTVTDSNWPIPAYSQHHTRAHCFVNSASRTNRKPRCPARLARRSVPRASGVGVLATIAVLLATAVEALTDGYVARPSSVERRSTSLFPRSTSVAPRSTDFSLLCDQRGPTVEAFGTARRGADIRTAGTLCCSRAARKDSRAPQSC